MNGIAFNAQPQALAPSGKVDVQPAPTGVKRDKRTRIKLEETSQEMKRHEKFLPQRIA